MPAHLMQYELVDSKVEAYDPNYPQVFQKVKDLISHLMPELVIEHIGSTAIPGIYAKRIIDILIPCSRTDFAYILSNLEKIGFQKTPFNNIPEDRPMKVAGIVFQEQFYNIHIHLTPENSEVHLNNIYFRERLRENQLLAKEYERIKIAAVVSGKVEATEYNLAKSPFIQSVLNKTKSCN